MKKPRVKFDYSGLSDSDLLTFSQAVVAGMTLNTSFFPEPIPTVAAVAAMNTAYSGFLSAAASRDKTAVASKDELRDTLILMLADLAAYVNNLASGDVSKLASSGFAIVKTAEPLPPIDIPKNFLVQAGLNTGEIALSIDRVKGALSYNFQVTPDPLTAESVWDTRPTSRSKFVFNNLEVGKTYWFRVAAVGPRDQVTICNPQGRAAA